MEKASRDMRSISASPKKFDFSATGGDMATFLVVDLPDRQDAPRLKYHLRYDGP